LGYTGFLKVARDGKGENAMEKFRIYLLPPFTKNALSYIIPLSACMYFFRKYTGFKGKMYMVYIIQTYLLYIHL